MDATAQEIQDREQSVTNETPELVDDGGDDDGETSSLPLPSIDRRYLAVVAAIIVAIAAWKLYQRRNSSSGGSSIAEEREKLEQRHEVEAAPDDGDAERIEVPIDSSDPLAADRAVIEALRSNGKLKVPEQ
jgi:hypothetical protein